MHCLGSFLMQDMSPRICFRGTKYEIYREHVAYLEHIQWNPDFSNLQGKRKLVREIGGKITVFD